MAQAMTAHEDLVTADYDDEADVLYVTFGEARPGYGDEGPENVILRYADDGSPSGATIIGYTILGWSARKGELAKIIGAHIKVGPVEVLTALRRAGL